MKDKRLIIGLLVIIAVIVVMFALSKAVKGNYDEFAMCIEESGAKFYGAFWCPHCQDQKALFGNSAKKLPYIECSTADRQGQIEVCKEEEIKLYPTWKFTEGTVEEKVMSLVELSEKTGCPLVSGDNEVENIESNPE